MSKLTLVSVAFAAGVTLSSVTLLRLIMDDTGRRDAPAQAERLSNGQMITNWDWTCERPGDHGSNFWRVDRGTGEVVRVYGGLHLDGTIYQC